MNSTTAKNRGNGSRDFKLPIRHESQRLEVSSWNEPHRACGMVCVHMALTYYESRGLLTKPLATLDFLIGEGKEMGGLMDGIGWRHDYLVNTFRDYGINCEREEGMDASRAMPRFADYIERCEDPVLVSTQHVRFGPDDKLTHIVLLTGVRYSGNGELEGFFFHDPNVYSKDEGHHRFVSVHNFPQGWRRMAILPCMKM